MRYASLALRRDMLRVGCNSSGITSTSAIECPGSLKCRFRGVPIVCCLSMFFKTFTKGAFSFTYILFLHLLHWIIYVRFVESQADECDV